MLKYSEIIRVYNIINENNIISFCFQKLIEGNSYYIFDI